MADTPSDPETGRSSDPESSGAGSGHSRARTAMLGTAATLVGLTTGVLTLKDQFFPPDQPSAQTVAQYQQQVGEVCDTANAVQSSNLRRTRPYKKRLRKARDLGELRNAVMDEVQNRIDSGGDLRGRLAGLEAPSKKLQAVQDKTVANWDKNLSALQAYREELEGLASNTELTRAVGGVDRSSIETNSLQARAQLRRLGGPSCDLEPRKTSPVVDLPRVGGRGEDGGGGSSRAGGGGNTRSGGGGGRSGGGGGRAGGGGGSRAGGGGSTSAGGGGSSAVSNSNASPPQFAAPPDPAPDSEGDVEEDE